MKFIKGSYERILRNHEEIRRKEYNNGDYFLKYDYPNNFLVNLCIVKCNDDEVDIEVIKKYDVNTAKIIKPSELKKEVQDYLQSEFEKGKAEEEKEMEI